MMMIIFDGLIDWWTDGLDDGMIDGLFGYVALISPFPSKWCSFYTEDAWSQEGLQGVHANKAGEITKLYSGECWRQPSADLR